MLNIRVAKIVRFRLAGYSNAPRDSKIADLEQNTSGGERARLRFEVDHGADGVAHARSQWFQVYDADPVFPRLACRPHAGAFNCNSGQPTGPVRRAFGVCGQRWLVGASLSMRGWSI
ncbi:MAG: hypothetical protein CMJ64_03130 [Planctomycetaceae bacterium]|nr:hypothetical protein [Planctomycetaceae bacterium]